MTSLNAQEPAAAARHDATSLAPALFAATLFVSALLLFAVQPMFTKMVLPRLGGSPTVWSVAMVAFQAFLFIGYVYAHVLARRLAPRAAAMVHLAFLALVALTLPLGLSERFAVPPNDGVTLWLVGLFAASIGLPFIALSASAPLLQNWFIATGHLQARNPYVLYAASNLGSFAALIAYPFVIEPFLTLQQQIALWSAGFAALAVLIASAACLATLPTAAASALTGAMPKRAQRLYWIALTAIPAGLSIAVTSYIATDLASAPFLWIAPLALYLMTFIAVFRDRPFVPHATVLRLVPYVVAPLAISIFGDPGSWLAVCLLNLTAFMLIALACHGEAYRRRPDAGQLTEFYLWTSFGGVLGGGFAGLIAPHIFNNIYEYPILIVAALLVLPGMFGSGVRGFVREVAPILIPLAALATLFLVGGVGLRQVGELPRSVVLVGLAAMILFQAAHPARHVTLVVLSFLFTGYWNTGTRPIETARSFFGVHQVVETTDGTHRLLLHGTTIHGAERIRSADGTVAAGRPTPLTYYYFGGPMSEAIAATRATHGALGEVAVVGLGTGSLACHSRGNERWTFFEIDPEVIRIARDASKFRFLTKCAPNLPIVAGDARLTLAGSSRRYDLIVLDAFSSDAIPVHLMTREAFAGYLSRLAPHGVIVVHVSNRHMELASVVAKVGAAEGLFAFIKHDNEANDVTKDYRANADVVALARADADLGDLPARKGWHSLPPPANVATWTDDYSNVLAAIWRRKFGS